MKFSLSPVCISAMAVATTAVTALVASPAQALLISGTPSWTPTVNLPTTLGVTGESASQQDGVPFDNLFSSLGSIQVESLSLKSSSPTPGFQSSYDATPGYVTGFLYNGQNAVINLLAGDNVRHTVDTFGVSTLNFDFQGEVVSGSNVLAKVAGTFSANRGTTGKGNFSLDIASTPVPTPALLPAALGMGAAALRKRRKQEEADADPASEPVEA